MKINNSLPRPIREIENTFITLADGAKLAARIWLPEDAEQNPVPAILEYVPYRKNDTLAHRDSIMHPYVAGHGYACVRVDVRGSGDSDGILFDEYLPQELSDGAEVIAWLAAQKWCTGSVGLLGKSWGGFNGLQIAALRPPALKAVISVCSTDDRYADDVHYVGGCVLGSDMLSWASTMLAYNAKPPDPRFVGERWREMWLDRMERTPPFVEAWLTHQRRDAFWKHGSVCEPGRFVNRPYGDITCPVYLIGGWADAYTNAIPRLLAGLSSPRKGLIGPWAHIYPHEGAPGPLIGFNQECLRWWDHWLKGIDTGIMAEPMLRAWMQESEPPKTFYAVRSGRWVAENEWPPRRDAPAERLYLDRGGRLSSLPLDALESAPPQETQIDFVGAQVCGLDSGTWCPYGLPGDMPPDQRGDDGLSLCFDSAPLAERVEILGFPEVTLALAADQPNALVAARLCDVSPTGESTRVSWGVLNLTHRKSEPEVSDFGQRRETLDSHQRPTPIEPGKRYTVTIRLNATGYSLLAGHRWRVALSPTYWPQAWPSPHPVTLSLFPGEECYLDLPTRTPRPEDESLAPFAEPEISPPIPMETLRAESRRREIHRDLISGRVTLTDHNDDGLVKIIDNGIEFDTLHTNTFAIVEGDPLSAEARTDFTIDIGRGEWRVRVETSSVMTADATTFRVTNVLNGYEGNTRVFGKTWTFSVARDLV